MRRLIPLAICLIGVACASRPATITDGSESVAQGSARLTVRVLGLESDEGQVAVALYDSVESFKQRSGEVAKGRIAPRDGDASWTFEDLRPGVYAVAVYHDVNGNGELDRATLGPPDEPYGFSNNARGTFGPPKFDKAAIAIQPGDRIIEVRLR
jgi:uncharacterized protein (DUF2141 family)